MKLTDKQKKYLKLTGLVLVGIAYWIGMFIIALATSTKKSVQKPPQVISNSNKGGH